MRPIRVRRCRVANERLYTQYIEKGFSAYNPGYRIGWHRETWRQFPLSLSGATRRLTGRAGITRAAQRRAAER